MRYWLGPSLYSPYRRSRPAADRRPVWERWPRFFAGRWRILHELAREHGHPEWEPPPVRLTVMARTEAGPGVPPG